MHLRKLITLSSIAMLMACSKPDLPDPKIEYPPAPTELMQPPEKMKPL